MDSEVSALLRWAWLRWTWPVLAVMAFQALILPIGDRDLTAWFVCIDLVFAAIQVADFRKCRKVLRELDEILRAIGSTEQQQERPAND